MKFRNYLDTIADIGIYPLVSLLLFFVFFLGLLWYVLTMNKKEAGEQAAIPLDDGTQLKRTVLTVLFGLTAFTGNAQRTSGETVAGNPELVLTLAIVGFIFMGIILLFIMVQTIRISRHLTYRERPEKVSQPLFSNAWWRKFSGVSTPVDDEEKILIQGHEYDGIQELDNRMPPWLSFLFQGTILFAVVYMVIYHGLKIADLPEAELARELQRAEIQKAAFLERAGALIDENSVEVTTDAAALETGKSLYLANCAACHGPEGEGTVGPNLTDAYWLHGGGIQNLFKTIKYGVPEKGMIAWEKQLKPQEIQFVSSYILTLAGTNPANSKEAQGELWEEEMAAER